MELSGNLWEAPVTIANATGRAFTGTHGDGVLSTNGDANVATWPGIDGIGAGWRGGAWNNSTFRLEVSDRDYSVNSNANRFSYAGFRAVRR
jgi:hypothetical protein